MYNLRSRGWGGVSQVKGERTSAWVWARLRSRRWPGTLNMAGKEESKVRSIMLIFINDLVIRNGKKIHNYTDFLGLK